MAYEIGGRADKYGNRFETNWAINKLLDVIEEKIESVMIEGLGEEEPGTDLWIKYKDGRCEAQQCKGRNGSQENWDYSSIKRKAIIDNWKFQLERSNSISVSLVSPLSFTMFEDIVNRARTNGFDAKKFYENQILSSGRDTISLFNNICEELGIDLSEEQGINKALNYFSRMYYRQVPDGELKNYNMARINRIFTGNPESVYRVLLDYLISEDIFGVKNDLMMLNNYLKKNNAKYRNLANDERIMPAINRLNDEYNQLFSPLSCGLIEREETRRCIDAINNGKSVILHGIAGIGKSGCTENLIHNLNVLGISYIAIKLDRNIPSGNSELWANTIGLPASITYCMDAITKEKAVIILDQLDALRWTQSHSADALSICIQMIREIDNINKEREIPISFVFVCRSYDLSNDKTIKRLFLDDDKWIKIGVGPLKDNEIKNVIGVQFNEIPSKTKRLLSIPSNLYIWEKLDKEKSYENIGATYQLVSEWWRQITLSGNEKNLKTDELERIKKHIVDFCYKNGKSNVPMVMIDIPADYEEFLKSYGFIVVNKKIVSFIHQSILDCFFAEEMLRQFYLREDILEILGPKNMQTPVRRYQTQIFMQQLYEYSVNDFLNAGNTMLNASCIRYSFKYIFIEVLSQLDSPEERIIAFVIALLEKSDWKQSIINSIIRGSAYYIHILRDNGLLDTWMERRDSQELVLDLLYSIRNNYDDSDVKLIGKYVFDSANLENWIPIFSGDIDQDIDSFYELRLELYNKFPDLLSKYADAINLIKPSGIRTIRLLSLMLKNKVRVKDNVWYNYTENNLLKDREVFISQYKDILDWFLPYFPDINENLFFSRFCVHNSFANGLERICVIVVKFATEVFADLDPEGFLDYYSFAFEKGNALYNEIILDAMLYLDDSYADYVMNYLMQNSFVNAIEDSSGSGNKLFLAKKLIKRFSSLCSDSVLASFENTLRNFMEIDAKDDLEYRISVNHERKKQKESLVYSSFWGDIQLELIPEICECRRSKELNDILSVLIRRNDENKLHSKYLYIYDSPVCSVVSPVSGKKLSLKNWIDIIFNVSSTQLGNTKWDYEKRICTESSLGMFANDFRRYVSDNPLEISEYLCDKDTEKMNDVFIDELFIGLSNSSSCELITEDTLRKLIEKYGYDYESNRASNIAELISKIHINDHKDYFLEVLWDIIENHNASNMISVNDSENENNASVDTIEINSLNCVRGRALKSVSDLLWTDRSIFEKYKNRIDNIIDESNSIIIRFALLDVLWPIYNYDKKWASSRIFRLFKSDVRLVGYRDSRRMFCYCYDDYSETIKKLIICALESDDSRLNCIASYSIVELYMHKDMFNNVYEIYVSANKNKKKSMLEMIILYFSEEKYRSKSKALLEKIILLEDDKDNDILWGRLFRDKIVKPDEDEILISNILKSKIKKHVLSDFSEFITEERTIKEFSDLILELTENIIENPKDIKYIWGIENELINLIFCLYDKTSNDYTEESSIIASRCLDLWDRMYEKNVGMARSLTEQLMEKC